jgi:hypothetical protein
VQDISTENMFKKNNRNIEKVYNKMIEEKLNLMLSNHNFKKINSNTEGVYFLFRFMNNEAEIILVLHAEAGDEFSEAQYIHILEQMKNNFINRGIYKTNLLSLILTNAPDRVKKWCLQEGDNHWIINMHANQLIIYEMQTKTFEVIRDEIEKIFLEVRQASSQFQKEGNGYTDKLPRSYKNAQNVLHKNRLLTPVNTIIIMINIIVYIIMYHTNLFKVFDYNDGELMWIAIIKNHEYYRC